MLFLIEPLAFITRPIFPFKDPVSIEFPLVEVPFVLAPVFQDQMPFVLDANTFFEELLHYLRHGGSRS